MASPQAEPIELSAKQAAAFCGVCYDTFLRYTQSSNPPPSANGTTYRSDDLGRWIRGTVTGPDGDDPTTINGPYERARKVRAMADKLELENRARRGELVEASDVEAMWALILMRVKTKILGLPNALAPVVATEDDPAVCRERLDEACRDALEELAHGLDGQAPAMDHR